MDVIQHGYLIGRAMWFVGSGCPASVRSELLHVACRDDAIAFGRLVPYRGELHAHCYDARFCRVAR